MPENEKNNSSKATKRTEDKDEKPKCFVMMPFSDSIDYETNHFTKVFEQIISPAIIKAGYDVVRVDQNKISDQIINKIIEGIVECDMAICDLSTNNPNVLYELGLRHAFDKPVVLIKDNKTSKIFDIQGISIIPYRSERLYDEVLEDIDLITNAINANKSNKSGYSVLNLVKLRRATYNENDIDSSTSNINTALLHQIIAMLTTQKQENNDNNSYVIYKSTEVFISNTSSRVDELSSIIKDSINGGLIINSEKIETELIRLQNTITEYLYSNPNTSSSQRRRLRTITSQITELLSILPKCNSDFQTNNHR